MHIIVVGAGFAGLTASRDLAGSGHKVTVVEARDRVGGRVVNHRFADGLTVELGGQWVGPTQTHILGLIRELGLKTFPTYDTGEYLVAMDGKVKRFSGDTFGLSPHVLVEAGIVQKRLERMAATVPLDAPWTAPKATNWDTQTLETWLQHNLRFERTRQFWRSVCGAIFSAEASEISLLHFLFYCHSGGMLNRLMGTRDGAQESRVVGGTHAVAEAMAAELVSHLRLGEPVRSIRQSDDRVQVTTSRTTYEGDAVIVTVPPHLVSAIEFDPPLPAGRSQLMKNMSMGSVIKCVVRYPTPFWRAQGLAGFAVSLDHDLSLVFDNSPPDAPCGLLVGFFEGKHGRAASRLTASARRERAIDVFSTLFGPQAAEPTEYAEIDWAAEHWSGGGYSAHLAPGVWSQLGQNLRTPHGRVFWAGTETATQWNGYIDGAVSSGRNAAKAVNKLVPSTRNPILGGAL